MPQPDHAIIRAVLGQVLSDRQAEDLDPRAGAIKTEVGLPITSAEDAWSVFMQLDGPGWLQNAHTEKILHGDKPALTVQLDAVASENRWPVAGERASDDGKRSLHLRRSANGWILTHFTEANSLNGILLTKRLLSADLQYYLVYHVAYEPQSIGGHEELRPVASSFVRFEEVPAPQATVTKS